MSSRSFSTGKKSASAKANAYLRAARQGRQSVTAWLSVPLRSQANYEGEQVRIWAKLVDDPMYLHFASVYDEVAVRKVIVNGQLISYVNESLVNGQQFSTALCHYWDRNGTNFNKPAAYDEAIRRSSAKVVPGIQYGKSQSIFNSITPTTAQEKQLYLPTEVVYDAFVKNDTVALQKVNTLTTMWNPVFSRILKDGKAAFQFQFKIQVIFRSVRYLSIQKVTPDDGNKEDEKKESNFDIGVGTIKNQGTAQQTDLQLVSLNPLSLTANNLWTAQVISTTANVKKLADSHPVLKQPGGSALIAVAFKRNTTNLLEEKIQKRMVKISIDSSAVDTMKKLYQTNTPEYSMIGTQVTPNRLGQLSRAEDDQINTGINRLVVDGKLYDPVYEGISATGYMDLMGPPDDPDTANYNTGLYSQGNAWVECGSKTDEELYNINLTNTGPDYEYVFPPESALQVEISPYESEYVQGPENVLQQKTRFLEQASETTELRMAFQSTPLFHDAMEIINASYTAITTIHTSSQTTYVEGTMHAGVDPAVADIQFIVYNDWQSDSVLGNNPDFALSKYPGQKLVIRTKDNQPIVLQQRKVASLLALANSTATFEIIQTTAGSTRVDYVTNYIDLLASGVYQYNIYGASKVWARIKGGLSKAFAWVAGLARKVVPIASRVIPPPYGTIVGTVGSAITAIDATLNVGATTSQANTYSLTSIVQVEDDDGFDVTVQYRLAIPGSEPADITKHGTDWIDAQTIRVPLKSIQTIESSFRSYIQVASPRVWEELQLYRQSLTGDSQDISYQVRAKVAFQKKMTQEQANNFRATLRLGSSVGTSDEQPLLNNMELPEEEE